MNALDLVFRYKVIYYFLLFAIYGLREFEDSSYYNTLRRVQKNTKIIDPFNVTNMAGFVYFSVVNATYPEIHDDYTNMNIFGGVVNRRVDYCQYVKNSRSMNFFSGSEIETYSTKWVKHYINSSDYVDQNYKNLPLSIVVNQTSQYNNVTVGDITINSYLYTNDLPFYYFDPTPELKNFNQSEASQDFEFIKHGYFYHSLPNKPTAKERIAKYLNEIDQNFQTKNLTNTEKYRLAINTLFSKCYSGEVRIQYRIYGPKNVTYFGYLKDSTLYPEIVDGYRFGTTKRGANKNLIDLIEYFMIDEKDTNISPIFVKSKIVLDILAIICYHFSSEPFKFVYWFVASGCINLAFRSLFWESWYLDFDFWFFVSLIILMLGFMFRVWSFPFQRPIEAHINVHFHIHLDQQATERLLRTQRNPNTQQVNGPLNTEINGPLNQTNIPVNEINHAINQEVIIPVNRNLENGQTININHEISIHQDIDIPNVQDEVTIRRRNPTPTDPTPQ